MTSTNQCEVANSIKDKNTSPGDVDSTNGERDATGSSGLNNPYHFPPFFLNFGDRFNGAPVWHVPFVDDPLKHVAQVRELPMREDDILLAVYPKCGTHWVSEILHMLTSGSASYSTKTKEFTMLEFMNDLPALETLPSPRVINSHLLFTQLPKEIVEKKVKIVHVIRNPKDTAVSMYHHIKQDSTNEKFNFDNFIKGYVIDEYVCLSHQFDYLRQMSQFEKANRDHPIIHLHFEDLKEDPVFVIQDLAKFLGKPVDEKFCREVADACSFNKMKKADESRNIPEHFQKNRDKVLQGKKLQLYRKGVVGDWKNSFTVAQNEMFDEFIRAQTEKGCAFTFKGTF